jgi:hypothetical protein
VCIHRSFAGLCQFKDNPSSGPLYCDAERGAEHPGEVRDPRCQPGQAGGDRRYRDPTTGPVFGASPAPVMTNAVSVSGSGRPHLHRVSHGRTGTRAHG